MRFLAQLEALKPTFATYIAAAWTTAQVAVWKSVITDWAAILTIILGVPTGAFILAYWALKARKEWINRNK